MLQHNVMTKCKGQYMFAKCKVQIIYSSERMFIQSVQMINIFNVRNILWSY